jgi:hypothetical protein
VFSDSNARRYGVTEAPPCEVLCLAPLERLREGSGERWEGRAGEAQVLGKPKARRGRPASERGATPD